MKSDLKGAWVVAVKVMWFTSYTAWAQHAVQNCTLSFRFS